MLFAACSSLLLSWVDIWQLAQLLQLVQKLLQAAVALLVSTCTMKCCSTLPELL